MELYHGSAYDFDQFDLNKIGSGDGRDKYGFGFYFSDDEDATINHAKQNLIGKKRYLYTVKVFNSDYIYDYGESINDSVFYSIIRILNKQGEDTDTWQEEYEEQRFTWKDVQKYLEATFDKKAASKIFDSLNVTGFKISDDPWYGNTYIIFSPSNLKIIDQKTI